MLSVTVHKDITEYEPKIVGQLTARTLGCIAGALGVSVIIGSYFYFVLGLGYEVSMYAIITAAIPLWALGFWRPLGMKPEEFIPLWMRHRLCDNVLYLKSRDLRPSHASGADRRYEKICRLRGIELIAPSEISA